MGTTTLVQETRTQSTPQPSRRLAETKQQVLSAVAANSYEDVKKKFSNPELFEGTRPIAESKSGKGGALSGVAPNDPGVDISSIPGFGSWSNVAAATRK